MSQKWRGISERLRKVQEFYESNYRQNLPQISVQNSLKDSTVTGGDISDSKHTLNSLQGGGEQGGGGQDGVHGTNWNRRLKRGTSIYNHHIQLVMLRF